MDHRAQGGDADPLQARHHCQRRFFTASILSRGIRFYAVALLLWWFGPPVRRFVEERLGLVALVGTLLLVGGFVVVRYII